MNRYRSRILLCAAALVLTFALNAVAATTYYTSESDFIANISAGRYLEDFNNYHYGSYQAPTLSLSGGSGFAYTIGTVPGLSVLYSGDGNMSTDNSGDALRVTFTGSPVFAVGGFFWASDINGDYLGGNVVLTLDNGTTRTFNAPNAITFGGFISDLPITTITIEAPDGTDSVWSTMDHFYVGSVVPEPSALGLAGLGIAALLCFRRRS